MRTLAVFDLDGVLVDSRQANVEAFSRGLEALGLPRPAEEAVMELVGRPALEMLAALGCPRERCRTLFEEVVRPAYLEALPRQARAMPGALEALERLVAAEVRVCACTSGTRDVQEPVLRHTGLLPLLEELQTPCRSPFRKPDPRYLGELVEGLGEFDTVYHVEDTGEGVAMGLAWGATTIFCSYGYGSPGEARPDHVAGTPLEVAEIVLRR